MGEISVPLWVVLLAVSVMVLVVAFAIGFARGEEHAGGGYFTPSCDTRYSLGCAFAAGAFVFVLAAWAALGWVF